MKIDGRNRVKHEKAINAFCSQNKSSFPGNMNLNTKS